MLVRYHRERVDKMSAVTQLRGVMHLFTPTTARHLSDGQYFVVYALGTDDAATWVYIDDGHAAPFAYPVLIFEVTDPRPSRLWLEGGDPEYRLLAPPDWALEPYYYDRLTDGAPATVAGFREYKRFMDLEFARPDIALTAIPLGDNWLMCAHCSESWELEAQTELVRCPRCNTLQRSVP